MQPAQIVAQYKGGAFKLTQYDRWHVVVSGPTMTEELRKAPDNVLSTNDAISEVCAIKYHYGNVYNSLYHVSTYKFNIQSARTCKTTAITYLSYALN